MNIYLVFYKIWIRFAHSREENWNLFAQNKFEFLTTFKILNIKISNTVEFKI